MIRKIFRVTVPVLLIACGLWLLRASFTPQPESVQRQAAVRSLTTADGTPRSFAAPAANVQVADPISVDLGDIPPGVRDPNSQLDRWQRGEIDLDENDSIRTQAEVAQLQQASLSLPAMPVSPNNPTQQVPAATLGFDSIDFTECCGGGGSVPPDPELAVGPDHIIAVVNVALEIYDKSGSSLLGPTTLSSFMAGDSNCTGLFDPNAMYDEQADRFIVGADAGGTHYCLAVSQTADPTAGWNLYSFQTGSALLFFDYPHAGVGRDAIYMGANMFKSGFLDSRVWAFDKWAMYAGNPTTAVMQNLGGNDDTPQPMQLNGWGQGTWPDAGPHYILTETNYNGRDYTVWSWDDPFGANTVTAVGTVDLSAATGVTAGYPLSAPQNGGSSLQGNDYRPQDFEYRNGTAWTTMTIACNPGSGSVNCVRWAEIDLETAAVVQAGVVASNGDYRFFPDLAVNHCDDMAVGYTKTNGGIFPAVWYAGREGGDAAGTLQAEVELKAGQVTYTAFDSAPHRWGDYTEMRVDPDGVTLWYLGHYSKNTGTTSGRWGTYISAIDFGSCTAPDNPPTSTPTATASSSTPTATLVNTATATPSSTPSSTPQTTATTTQTPPSTVTATPTHTPTATPTATPPPDKETQFFLPFIGVSP